MTLTLESAGTAARPAAALQVEHWLNTAAPLTLAGLRGRVVVLHAFQMLCPACVLHALPQAARLHAQFEAAEVAVLGLHTVFEHHAVMQPLASLRAFVHEFRLRFPIGVDRADPAGSALPLTMQSLRLRGTPSLLLLDRQGRIRAHAFGHQDDLAVGAAIGRLAAERDDGARGTPPTSPP